MITNIIKIIMCHIVGDYLLQTDYMAREKTKSIYVLLIHCVCYCLSFIYAFGLDSRAFLLFNCHIVIDEAKCKGKIDIVLDQVLHYIIAVIIYVC